MTTNGYVERRIERTYRVRFDEAGPDGNLRSGGYLRFAQDLAWIHSESAGFGREWYGERGLFWLVRGVELEILDAVEFGSEVVVSTEVIGFRRVIARRRSEIRRVGSERIIAEAFTDWVLLNDAGRPVRPPEEIPRRSARSPTSRHCAWTLGLRLRRPTSAPSLCDGQRRTRWPTSTTRAISTTSTSNT